MEDNYPLPQDQQPDYPYYTPPPQPRPEHQPYQAPAHPHHQHQPAQYQSPQPQIQLQIQHSRPHYPQPHDHTRAEQGSTYSDVRSIEYVFMTITLLGTAFSLGLTIIFWINGWINGESSFRVVAYPVAMLIISLPLYSWLLFDLKHAEIYDPSLGQSIYRRLSNQFVRVAAFTTCFLAVIGLVFGILAHVGSNEGGSLGHLFGTTAVILVIAGGILAYYMRYEA